MCEGELDALGYAVPHRTVNSILADFMYACSMSSGSFFHQLFRRTLHKLLVVFMLDNSHDLLL
jgi:hypothetical protein